MNSGDGIDYHQRFSENIGDLIEVKLFKDPMLLPSHKKNSKTYCLAKCRISSSEKLGSLLSCMRACLKKREMSKMATLLKGQLLQDTLELMERRGGPDAFINIKYE